MGLDGLVVIPEGLGGLVVIPEKGIFACELIVRIHDILDNDTFLLHLLVDTGVVHTGGLGKVGLGELGIGLGLGLGGILALDVEVGLGVEGRVCGLLHLLRLTDGTRMAPNFPHLLRDTGDTSDTGGRGSGPVPGVLGIGVLGDMRTEPVDDEIRGHRHEGFVMAPAARGFALLHRRIFLGGYAVGLVGLVGLVDLSADLGVVGLRRAGSHFGVKARAVEPVDEFDPLDLVDQALDIDRVVVFVLLVNQTERDVLPK